MPRILMTGASGESGSGLRKLLPPIYPDLLLSDLETARPTWASREKFKAAEPADLAEGRGDLRGGRRHPSFRRVFGRRPLDAILQSNIIGGYNLFEAARRKGVKRVVFASSNHAVGFYPRHHRIGHRCDRPRAG